MDSVSAPPLPAVRAGQPAADIGPGFRGFRFALALIGVLLMTGFVAGLVLRGFPLGQRTGEVQGNVFYVLFAEHEPLICGVALLGMALLFAWIRSGRALFNLNDVTRAVPAWLSRRPLLALAAAALLIAAFGEANVFRGFALSMDEHLTDFQAQIFAEGQLFAKISEEWQPVVPWITSIFVFRDDVAHTWSSPYLPVYSALRAVFHLGACEWLLNPLLAFVSILAIGGVSKRLWPDAGKLQLLAPILLFASSQFLITSMTAYSMAAHLCFNLVWLWLYTRGDARSLAAAPLLGLFAVGLHQPHVHLLFALPFGVRLLRERRWKWAAYYAVVYVGAIVLWISWWKWARPTTGGGSSLPLSLPDAQQFLIQLMNVVLIFSWQSIAAGVLFLLALRRWRALPPVLQDCAWGCLLTFCLYLTFNSTQGHGWGYRYFYPVLGNFVLIAAAGWAALSAKIGSRSAAAFTAGSVVLAVAVLTPLRCLQTESFVRPFAAADDAIRSAKAETVLLPPFAAWYAHDLVRNDPFLRESPKVGILYRLNSGTVQAFEARGRVLVLTAEQLAQLGLTRTKVP